MQSGGERAAGSGARLSLVSRRRTVPVLSLVECAESAASQRRDEQSPRTAAAAADDDVVQRVPSARACRL